jgi:hypothetical protein
MVRPVCFMIMPYGRKPTMVEQGKGPAEINFNALWDKAFVPVIQELGYEPVRADQEIGAMIINQMLERLYFSDLVLADMSIANGNVYYEVGIRHAAKDKGCVLLAADWSKQLFDLAQMRTIRYPLPEGEVSAETALAIRAAIKDAIARLAEGTSPMCEAIPGFPNDVEPERASSIRNEMKALADFQAKTRAVRAAPGAERCRLADEIVEEFGQPPMMPAVAQGLLRMLETCVVRDADWQRPVDFIDRLPADIRALPQVQEKRALALSKLGRHIDAIAVLESLIAEHGSTSEREALLGGRYKALLKSSATPRERLEHLNAAIEHYERGMMLDLNDYYPSSNLPRLYRQRGLKSDEGHALAVLQVVMMACRRARQRGATDEWVRPTELGAAFDAGDVERAEELYEEVATEGADEWKLATLFADLERSLDQHLDPERKLALGEVLQRLRALM